MRKLLSLWIAVFVFISFPLIQAPGADAEQIVFEKTIVVREYREAGDNIPDEIGPPVQAEQILPLALDDFPAVSPQNLEEEDTESGEEVNLSDMPPSSDVYPAIQALDITEEDAESDQEVELQDMTPFLENYPFAEPLDVTEDDTESDLPVSESDLPPFLDNYPVVAAQETEEDDSDEIPGNDIGIQGYTPNLTPYKPSGWSGAVVISDRTGTNTDTAIQAGKTVYIDYAFANNGGADIGVTFYSALYINGSLVRTGTAYGLKKGYYGYAQDFGYIFSKAGTYTVKLVCDVNRNVSESNEADNTYQISKSAADNNIKPNLTPYKPSGWSASIVVSDRTGTNTDNVLYAGSRGYIDYAFINNGQSDIGSTFYSALYINGSLVRNGASYGLKKGYYGYTQDFGYTFSQVGTYTIKLVCDVNGNVPESSECDNICQRSISVGNIQKANLTPYKPSGWSASIVVSDQTGTSADTVLYTGKTGYIDYSFVNNGLTDSPGTFNSALYINGSLVRKGSSYGLKKGYYGYCADMGYVFSQAGNYTIKLVCDVDGNVSESNENDNVYQRTVTVIPSPKSNLVPYKPSGWSAAIVVSDRTGTNSDNALFKGKTGYIDYAFINNGQSDIAGTFYTALYINGSLIRTGACNGLGKGRYAYAPDIPYTFLQAGSYLIKLVCDVNRNVSESNENDNEYQRSISVPDDAKPNLIPYRPDGWDDKIVVSAENGTSKETAVYAGKTAYIDYAYVNNGDVNISSRFYTDFYVNNTRVRQGYTDGLNKGYYAYIRDMAYVFPQVGTYTLKVVCDVYNNVQESNENDNSYQKSKTVGIVNGSPVIRVSPTNISMSNNQNMALDLPDGTWVPFGIGAAALPQKSPETKVVQSGKEALELNLFSNGMFVNELAEGADLFKSLQLGEYQGDLPPGSPNLPVVRKYIYVPQEEAPVLNYELNEPVSIPNYLVYPIQPPASDTVGAESPAFYMDQAVYGQNQWLPAENVYLGPMEMIRGHRVQMLNICPFRYNPVTKELQAFPDIDVRIEFKAQPGVSDIRYSSPEFDNFVQGSVVNPEAFIGYQNVNGVFAAGAQYLIITAPEFLGPANVLKDAKIARGISTVVKTTSETGKTKDQIKIYIRNAYNTWSPAPTYVLLLGDVEYIPTTYETTRERGTDLYYSTVSGSDYVPDIFLGRISVDTEAQAYTVIRKIVNYESNPPDAPNFYKNVATAAYFEDGGPDKPIKYVYDGYADRRFLKTSEEIRDFLMSQGYNVKRIYTTDAAANPTNYHKAAAWGGGEALPAELLRKNGFPWDGDAADISSAINTGVFLLTHRDHGMDRNDGHSHTGWGDPYFVEDHITALRNGSLLPVVLSFNCQSGWFDGETDHNSGRNYESFCELFLRKENGGTVGIIGATRNSYSGYNDAMIRGVIDCVWPSFITEVSNNAVNQLGPMLLYGKTTMDKIYGDPSGLRKTEYELFHLHGDPSMRMWTSAPNIPNPGKTSSTFVIYNDGNTDLKITGMSKKYNRSWLSFTPSTPFTVSPGKSATVTVTVDWAKTGAGINDEQILIYSNDADKSPQTVSVTASDRQENYALNLLNNGNGMVRVNGELFSLPTEKIFAKGESVTLEAVPEGDWQFEGWEEGGLAINENRFTVVMDSDKTLEINFANHNILHYPLRISKEGGNGRIRVNGQPYELPFVYSFPQGSAVKIEAFPAEDFEKWTGAVNSTDNPVTVTMNGDRQLACVFRQPSPLMCQTTIRINGAAMNGLSYEEWLNQGGDENVLVNSFTVQIGLGEQPELLEAPPDPPEYSVSVKLWNPDGWKGPFFRDIRSGEAVAQKWVLGISPHGNIEPAEPGTAMLNWDPASLCSEGTYRIREGHDGSGNVVVPDMRTVSAYKISGGEELQYFSIEYFRDTPVDMELTAGWNLISLPVSPDDNQLSSLFPEATVAYKFDETYQPVQQLYPGIGYWVKVPEDKTYKISGQPFRQYSLELSEGWHLMGALNTAASPTPGDAISAKFEFEESYIEADQLTPGKGCWVKIIKACTFSMTSP